MDFEEKALQNINNDEEEFILPEELLLNSILLFEGEDSSEEDSSKEDSSIEQENAKEPEEDSRTDVSETLNKGNEVNGPQNSQASESDNTYVQDLDVQKQENYYQKVKKELSTYLLKRQQITESLRYKIVFDKKTRYAEETKGFSQELGEISVDKSEKKINKNEYKHRSERGLKCKTIKRPKRSSLSGLDDIDGFGNFRESQSSGLVKDFDSQRLFKKEKEKKDGYVHRKAKRYKNLCIGEEKEPCIDEGKKKDLYIECEKEKKQYIDKEKKKEALGLLIGKQTKRLSDTASDQRHTFSICIDGFESEKSKLSLDDDKFRKKYDGFSMKV